MYDGALIACNILPVGPHTVVVTPACYPLFKASCEAFFRDHHQLLRRYLVILVNGFISPAFELHF